MEGGRRIHGRRMMLVPTPLPSREDGRGEGRGRGGGGGGVACHVKLTGLLVRNFKEKILQKVAESRLIGVAQMDFYP